MDRLKSKKFWEKVLERAIYTVAETFVAMSTGAIVFTDINWTYVLSASAFAGVLSIAKSIAVGVPECQIEDK